MTEYQENKIDLERIISAETLIRLNNHGLKVSADNSDSVFSRQAGEMDDNGIAAYLIGNGVYAKKSDEKSTPVKDIIHSEFSHDTEFHIELNGFTQSGAEIVYKPVYDIGHAEHFYTVTESDETCDFNACGYVATNLKVFMDNNNIEVMDDGAWAKLDDCFNEALKKSSAIATFGECAYYVSSYTNGMEAPHLAPIYSTALAEDADRSINKLIDDSVKRFDKSVLSLEIEIDKRFSDTDIHPLGYLNKELGFHRNLKLVFGTMDRQGTTLTVTASVYSEYLLRAFKEAIPELKTAEFIESWVNEIELLKQRNPDTEPVNREQKILELIGYAKTPSFPSCNKQNKNTDPDEYLALLRLITKDIYGISIEKVIITLDPDVEYHNNKEVPF